MLSPKKEFFYVFMLLAKKNKIEGKEKCKI